MAHHDQIHLIYIITTSADQVAEGDRIFKSHVKWMESTHNRDGEKALLHYTVSKAPEISNPLDSISSATGNTCFILDEIYETEAGVADHFQQAMSSWEDFSAFVEWIGKCTITGVPIAPIAHSLW